MADNATLALLQEIRDLQKQELECLRSSVANQHQSLTNQQQSLAVQQQVIEKQKLIVARSFKLWLFVLGSIFVLFFLVFCTIFSKLLLGR